MASQPSKGAPQPSHSPTLIAVGPFALDSPDKSRRRRTPLRPGERHGKRHEAADRRAAVGRSRATGDEARPCSGGRRSFRPYAEAMNSFERAERNADIVKSRVSGLSERLVAERFGVTTRQVRRVMEDYRRSRPGLHEIDAAALVAETIDAHGEAIEQLAQIAASTSHDGARLGAIRAQLEAHHARIGLLQAVGALPRDLGYFAVELDVRDAARTMLEVFRRRGVPEDVQAEVVEAISLSGDS